MRGGLALGRRREGRSLSSPASPGSRPVVIGLGRGSAGRQSPAELAARRAPPIACGTRATQGDGGEKTVGSV